MGGGMVPSLRQTAIGADDGCAVVELLRGWEWECEWEWEWARAWLRLRRLHQVLLDGRGVTAGQAPR